MKQRKSSNPKRRLASPDTATHTKLAQLSQAVTYSGHPAHKRNPGDFGLQPPSQPRQGKSLCDTANIFKHKEALRLLRDGIAKGLISMQERNGWPQNVWAVTEAGIAVEAMLENKGQGVYHGYPMLPGDPLAEQVLERWKNRP